MFMVFPKSFIFFICCHYFSCILQSWNIEDCTSFYLYNMLHQSERYRIIAFLIFDSTHRPWTYFSAYSVLSKVDHVDWINKYVEQLSKVHTKRSHQNERIKASLEAYVIDRQKWEVIIIDIDNDLLILLFFQFVYLVNFNRFFFTTIIFSLKFECALIHKINR